MNNVQAKVYNNLNTNDQAYVKAIYDLQDSFKGMTKKALKDITGVTYMIGENVSTKVEKGLSEGYYTYILYMLPESQGGFNVCPKADSCINVCLSASGNPAQMSHKMKSRWRRKMIYFYNRNLFNYLLFSDIKKAIARRGKKAVFRLNGTSDIPYNKFTYEGVNVLEKFPNAQFYEYTKVLTYVTKNKYKNLHYTFSADGLNNIDEQIQVLSMGGNVAVAFNSYKTLPNTYMGYKVIDADKTDLRFKDGKNVVAGLKAKRTYTEKNGKFKSNDINESSFFVSMDHPFVN